MIFCWKFLGEKILEFPRELELELFMYLKLGNFLGEYFVCLCLGFYNPKKKTQNYTKTSFTRKDVLTYVIFQPNESYVLNNVLTGNQVKKYF